MSGTEEREREAGYEGTGGSRKRKEDLSMHKVLYRGYGGNQATGTANTARTPTFSAYDHYFPLTGSFHSNREDSTGNTTAFASARVSFHLLGERPPRTSVHEKTKSDTGAWASPKGDDWGGEFQTGDRWTETFLLE